MGIAQVGTTLKPVLISPSVMSIPALGQLAGRQRPKLPFTWDFDVFALPGAPQEPSIIRAIPRSN